MSSNLDRRRERPLTVSRAIDEVCAHPVITGVAVVGVAVTLSALLYYGPTETGFRRPSLFERLRRAFGSLLD
ncbi:MAG: hypothetical protein PF501_14280 [Salinisphaera sp.]|nr:hypothetical protein [Salinisphaera sp.]